MLDLLSLPDATDALARAIDSKVQGVFNIPGCDRLPLSRAIRRWGRTEVPFPGPLVGPVYAARTLLRGGDFRYDLNQHRFHFNAILDGTRAATELGYRPAHPLRWPAGDKTARLDPAT